MSLTSSLQSRHWLWLIPKERILHESNRGLRLGSAFLCTVHQRGEFRRNPKNPNQDLLDQKEKRLFVKNDGPKKTNLLVLLNFVIYQNFGKPNTWPCFLCKNKPDTYAHLQMESVRLFQCSMIKTQHLSTWILHNEIST